MAALVMMKVTMNKSGGTNLLAIPQHSFWSSRRNIKMAVVVMMMMMKLALMKMNRRRRTKKSSINDEIVIRIVVAYRKCRNQRSVLECVLHAYAFIKST